MLSWLEYGGCPLEPFEVMKHCFSFLSVAVINIQAKNNLGKIGFMGICIPGYSPVYPLDKGKVEAGT